MSPHPDGLPSPYWLRERVRPRPRVGVTFEGWLHWRKVTRAGIITGEGEQHNLITDAGLDLLATAALHTMPTYAAVGTSSTPPDESDTSLGSQVDSRTNATGSTNPVLTRTGDGQYAYQVTREFDFAQGNGNLTEWGFAPTAAGDLWCRELFRDSGGTAVTVTKTSAEKLQLVYTITATITPTTSQVDSLDLTGVGPKDISWLVSRVGCYTQSGGVGTQANDPTADWGILNSFTRGNGYMAVNNNAAVRGVTYADRNGAFTNASTTSAGSSGTTWSVYVPGSCERTVEGKWLTTEANVTIAAYHLIYQGLSASRGDQTGVDSGLGQARGGWVARYDEGAELTKDNLHELTILGPVLTWGRA